MNTYTLEIEDKDDKVIYQFQLTADEIMNLSNIPYKISGSGNSGQPTSTRLDNAKLDAYRLGEDFHIVYDNDNSKDNHKGTIFPKPKYSEIEKILKDASDKILHKIDIATIKI